MGKEMIAMLLAGGQGSSKAVFVTTVLSLVTVPLMAAVI